MPKKSAINQPGRPADRRHEIMDFLQGQIVAGQFKPGDRLPIRRTLQQQFGSSMATVQQAMDRLITAGFVESRGVGGTFVSSRPPHLNHFGVIVPARQLDNATPLFWRTLMYSFADYSSKAAVTIKPYCWPPEQGATAESRLLVRNAARRGLAGLVFITSPLSHETEKTDLLNHGAVPRAVIMPRDVVAKFTAATVIIDDLAFIGKALDYFRAQGRKRVAVIANPRSDGWWRDFHRTVAEKGIETRPYWTFCIGNDAREHVRNMANLLMQLPKGKLPDALLITDDNLAKSAFAGLEDSGSAAVQKLKIISHTNFPFTVNTRLPVTFLGYDSAQVVAACMRALERQRRGEVPTTVSEYVIPVFDEERDTSL